MRTTFAAVLVFFFAISANSQESKDGPKENAYVTELLEQLGPNAKKPAGEVFKNVKLMQDVPADRFLRIMDIGYRQSLGVSCDYCHVEDRWEADEKRPKRAARQMIEMMRMINKHLGTLTEIDTQDAAVNCTTCHRGYVKPALQMR
jgi:hypothetical protein